MKTSKEEQERILAEEIERDDDDKYYELPEDTNDEAINAFNRWLNEDARKGRETQSKRVHNIVI